MKPQHRPDAVHNLVSGVDRYNPTNVVVLEEYLQDQTEKVTYDHYANLAILKLYQFNPDLVPSTEPSEDNPQPRPFTIFQILLLSLAHQPFGPDFKLALALLSDQMSPAYATPETLQDYAQLQQLQQHILSRDLPQVWSKLHALSSSPQLQRAYASLASLDDVLRRSLARDVLQPLFKSIAVVRFESWLNAQGKAAQVAGMLGEGWSVQGDHVMVPQVSQADSVGSKDAEDGLKGGKETLNLQKLSKLLKAA